MGRKNRSPEENERRAKIRELLQARNISSMDDIQNLFKETIAEFMEIRKNEPFYLLGKRLISVTVGFDGVPCVADLALNCPAKAAAPGPIFFALFQKISGRLTGIVKTALDMDGLAQVNDGGIVPALQYGFVNLVNVDDFLHIQFLSHNSCSVLWLRFCFSAAGCA